MALTRPPLYLYNSLTRKKELFTPIRSGIVCLYACGPTVYDYAHIGNFRGFLLPDILVRFLRTSGYTVTYVRNITDVGHLTDDADSGKDKIEEKAKEKGKSAYDVASFFTEAFETDAKKLGLIAPDTEPRATDFIKEQIAFIKELEEKGYTYRTSDGIYFNTGKSPEYGTLASVNVHELREGARVLKNPEKKLPTDFALWKLSPKDSERQMEWDSPWGIGFPGWHIECSAISKKLLGFPFDIHTGGIDHREIHHTNELAQNEALFGKCPVHFWLHSEFMTVNGGKMSKSLKNTFTVAHIEERGIPPLAFRYFALGTHYRQTLNFSWEALDSAARAYAGLCTHIERMQTENAHLGVLGRFRARKTRALWHEKFFSAIADDLGMPNALAVIWDLIKDGGVHTALKLSLLKDFDALLGLGLFAPGNSIPEHILRKSSERDMARKNKDWALADMLRSEIEKDGFIVEDTSEKARVLRKH